MEIRKQLGELLDMPWETKKFVRASKRKAQEGSDANCSEGE